MTISEVYHELIEEGKTKKEGAEEGSRPTDEGRSKERAFGHHRGKEG